MQSLQFLSKQKIIVTENIPRRSKYICICVQSFDYQMPSLTDSKQHQQMAVCTQRGAVHINITNWKPKDNKRKNLGTRGFVTLFI